MEINDNVASSDHINVRKERKITSVSRYLCDCEHVGLMLITVASDVT